MANGFCHVELSTTDVAAAKQFYAQLFDWKLSDMPMGPMVYTMIDAGKGAVGGGMQPISMPGQPVGWLSYIEVASVKATLEKARSAGAAIMLDYTPIGDDMGAIAVLADPQGAPFGLWESSAKRDAARKAAEKPAAKSKSKTKAKPVAKAKAKAKAKPAAKAKAKPKAKAKKR